LPQRLATALCAPASATMPIAAAVLSGAASTTWHTASSHWLTTGQSSLFTSVLGTAWAAPAAAMAASSCLPHLRRVRGAGQQALGGCRGAAAAGCLLQVLAPPAAPRSTSSGSQCQQQQQRRRRRRRRQQQPAAAAASTPAEVGVGGVAQRAHRVLQVPQLAGLAREQPLAEVPGLGGRHAVALQAAAPAGQRRRRPGARAPAARWPQRVQAGRPPPPRGPPRGAPASSRS
jgi:hypothetical protein